MAPGVDPSAFWSAALDPAQLCDAVSKYGALLELAAMPESGERAATLREVAARWPGALREAELAGPARCRIRLERAQQMSTAAPMARQSWRDDEEAAAVVLWIELHALLRDQLAHRRSGARTELDAFVEALAPDARARWGDAATLARVAGPKIRSRQAYLWLAARAGSSLPKLGHTLFARPGHWDHRPDDPAWAHPPDEPQIPQGGG